MVCRLWANILQVPVSVWSRTVCGRSAICQTLQPNRYVFIHPLLLLLLLLLPMLLLLEVLIPVLGAQKSMISHSACSQACLTTDSDTHKAEWGGTKRSFPLLFFIGQEWLTSQGTVADSIWTAPEKQHFITFSPQVDTSQPLFLY